MARTQPHSIIRPPRSTGVAALRVALVLPFVTTGALAAAPSLEQCAAIGAATDRLDCYDALAGRAPAPTQPPAKRPAPGETNAAPPMTSKIEPAGAALAPGGPVASQTSLLSKFWELEPQDRRGVFNFLGYRPNYVLPLHVTDRINRAPRSPTEPVAPYTDYQHGETKFQLSLRTKVLQELPFTGGDFWLAFTQVAFWQIYNGADSRPFRNTDYQPEAIYIQPTPTAWRSLPFGWQWRYTQIGLAHQSNGQSDPRSRSWNRTYGEVGFDRGDWFVTARYNERIGEPIESDNNPDLERFRGRGEFRLGWAHGLHTADLLVRSSLTNVRYGAVQLEYTYPIFRDQPNGLRWYLQAFHGYGETLTDYNFRQTSVGAGVTFLQF